MATEWFYTVNGQQAPTPATAAQLKQMATAGQLQPSDLVWQEGMANWAPASTIKGLFSGGRSPAEPAPLVEAPPAKGRGRAKPPKEEDEEEESSGGGLLGLHPLLVLLLTVCTLGLFGLVYAYVACSSHRERFTREADTAGRPLGSGRHPLTVLILSYLTLGIYFCFWASRAMDECRAYTGRKDADPRSDLALMLIFPPYLLFVAAVRLPEMIRAAQAAAKVPESAAVNNAYFFLIPCFFPALPLLGMAQQEALNQVWSQAP
jgi:hypothetical protein